MRLTLLLPCYFILGTALAADAPKESVYTLKDGRTVRGSTLSEDAENLTVEIQAGSVSAQIKLAKNEVAAIKTVEPKPAAAETPATMAAQEAPKPADKETVLDRSIADAEALALLKGPVAADGNDPDLKILARKAALILNDQPKGARIDADDSQEIAERLEANQSPLALLRQAILQADLEARDERVVPLLRNTLPYDSDPTYWDVYGPLWQGVYDENYRGLTYYDGVLPRSRALFNTKVLNHPNGYLKQFLPTGTKPYYFFPKQNQGHHHGKKGPV